VSVTDTTATISWDLSSCTGNHRLQAFTIRYVSPLRFFDFFRRFSFIRNIDINLRNYTITDLMPESTYDMAIAVSNEANAVSRYSVSRAISTLVQGKYIWNLSVFPVKYVLLAGLGGWGVNIQ
jgi:hypothetical protein